MSNNVSNMVDLVHGGTQSFLRVGAYWHAVDSVTIDHLGFKGSVTRLDVTFAVVRGRGVYMPVPDAVLRWLVS